MLGRTRLRGQCALEVRPEEAWPASHGGLETLETRGSKAGPALRGSLLLVAVRFVFIGAVVVYGCPDGGLGASDDVLLVVGGVGRSRGVVVVAAVALSLCTLSGGRFLFRALLLPVRSPGTWALWA